jgi:uncharacterized membrane-anchored protein YjiN (DUF445 family)
MREFSDNATPTRKWQVRINLHTARQVKDLTGVDLPNILDDRMEKLDALLKDDFKLYDVLYVLCKAQCDAAGLTDEQFGEGMAGDAIARGADAFLEELADFFRDPRIRKMFAKVLDKSKRVRDLTMDKLEARADKKLAEMPDEEVAEQIIAQLTAKLQTPGASPSSSAASSAFTPDPSP